MSNWEKTKKIGKFEIIYGYDSDIKFYLRITKLHGIEISFFNRLLSINFIKNDKTK